MAIRKKNIDRISYSDDNSLFLFCEIPIQYPLIKDISCTYQCLALFSTHTPNKATLIMHGLISSKYL